ncbi:hypothetical protein QOL99_02915 [Deinococcus sp. MIMF12]|uniref:TubC N-terminal docking domain-containing protein n=1 Tax=Deinococcus rhizophilus TaxID=3049544 RepID=A0ABT7JDG5_9DEIO|nr:hypothetical protein [Deinococcus rhizophilus]MDL2343096.1 hypothetical protein [Deinococcus rhizophilus]
MAGPILAALEAAGARLALTPDGEGLTLTGKRPPADVLEAVRAAKPALLEALRTAKEEAAPAAASSSPDLGTGGGVTSAHTLPDLAPWEDLPPTAKEGRGPPLPDWGALSALPGHCGSCARWEEAPDWGALMGTCGCPPSAWPGNLPPLAIHAGHRCAAYREEGQDFGRGYRAKAAGKRYGPRPLEDLGAA